MGFKGCPCEENCGKKRPKAVNLVLEKRICTAVELRAMLLNNGLGAYAARKSMEFLSFRRCKLIDVFATSADNKPMQFGRRGKVFFEKNMPTLELKAYILSLLSALQKRILAKFTKTNRRIYYFSAYEVRKMNPSPGHDIDYALERLTKLFFLKKVTLGFTDFYVEPSRVSDLEEQMLTASVDDKTEFAAINIVHELIMNLYPLNLIAGYHDRIRPHTRETLIATGGMAFDIFYPFHHEVIGKEYLAIDVYTRVPVTGFTVHSFRKKIEWAKKTTQKGYANCLKDKTYGMIIYRIATPKAISAANKAGIRFLRLSDIKIDYAKLHRDIESQVALERGT